jgi:Protein of unknown function (DUF3429)
LAEQQHSEVVLPSAALWFGYAGLLPQIIAAMLVSFGMEYRWIGLAAAYGYSALIFSFLGGIWWGFGLLTRKSTASSAAIFAISVLPSLIAFWTYLPWIIGYDWPGPSLAIIGLCLMASPLCDRWLQTQCDLPVGWMRLRWHLSLGLGGLTLILAFMA